MRLSFDNIEEVQDFVKRLKGARAGKGANDEIDAGAPANHTAPAPLLPPQGGMQTFNPGPAPGAQFTQPTVNAFPGASAVDPAVQALVSRIVPRMDASIAAGHSAADMLAWFRNQFGAEAANATLDQIKANFLPKLSVPALEQIAKLTGA